MIWAMIRRLRRAIARSWLLSKVYYRLCGLRVEGRPADAVWYFAFGANMHDSAFRERRRMRPSEWRAGRVTGYRLRFNLDGRPLGKAAPANIDADPRADPRADPLADPLADPPAEVWGVLYRITRADLLYLDATEGVPGRRYRQLWLVAEDADGRALDAVTYIAEGNAEDGKPSLRYITLLREGAAAHGLPAHYLDYLNDVEAAS